MGVIQAALSLYEREAGPMPDKVSYIEQILQMEEDNHTYFLSRCLSPLIFLDIPERLFLLISSSHKKWHLPSRKS